MSPVLLLVGFAIVAVGVAVLGWYTNKKRTEAIVAWARAAGWAYVGRDDGLALSLTRSPFGVGDEIEGVDAVRGTWQGLPAASFTYVSTEVTRDSKGRRQRHSTYFHVTTLELPTVLPFVELTPEGLGAKLVKAVGATDLEFESDDFNRTYRVDAAEPAVAYAIVHARLMERLLKPDLRGATWRINGGRILTWRSGHSDVSHIAGQLALLGAIVSSIPRHVWLDHGYDPAATA